MSAAALVQRLRQRGQSVTLAAGLASCAAQPVPAAELAVNDAQAVDVVDQASEDRDGDDRRACLECAHLAGTPNAWRCLNWRRANAAPKLPGVLVTLLQRCPGFSAGGRAP